MVTARRCFGLVFLYFNDFTTLILAALGADSMRQAFLTTVGASGKIESRHGIVGAAAIAAAFGMFTLWMRGHAFSLNDCIHFWI